jgi:YHS domain-containing protein
MTIRRMQMKTETKSIARAKHLFFAVLMALMLLAPAAQEASAGDSEPSNRSKSALARADVEYVCMINDELFQKKQIPVVVDDKTYYGCCAMCEKALRQDPRTRTAVDPVSGRPVDKATAVIGAASDRSVFYFESEANMRRFRPDPARNK